MKLTILLASAIGVYGACLPVESGRIRASDVAVAVPAFAQLPPDMELSFAPMPGAQRVFAAGELNQRLQRHGIAANVTEPVCFEWAMRDLAEEEVRSAMLAVLPDGSEVDFSATAPVRVPPGTLEFPLEGYRNGLWRGSVTYDKPRKTAFTIPVTVRVPWTRVVAAEQISTGERITAAKLQVTSGTGEPSRVQYIEDLKEAEGRMARRFIRAGMPLEKAALGNAHAIARGDTIRVDVISGGARLRFDGIAQASADLGAIVAVKNLDTGKIVHARVQSDGRAQLDLSLREN